MEELGVGEFFSRSPESKSNSGVHSYLRYVNF